MANIFSRKHDNDGKNEAIFRSETMKLVQFYVTIELAREAAHALGSLGSVHFRDLNSKLTPFQRNFIGELRDLDKVESELNGLFETMEHYHTELPVSVPSEFRPHLLPMVSEMDFLKSEIHKVYGKIQHLDRSYHSLIGRQRTYLENRLAINYVNKMHDSSFSGRYGIPDSIQRGSFDLNEANVGLLDQNHEATEDIEMVENDMQSVSFNSIVGIMLMERIPILRKILWRTLRGNLYFHEIPVEEGDEIYEHDSVKKSVFVVYIHGESLKLRVSKIIQSLDGTIFDNIRGTFDQRQKTLESLNALVGDLYNVVGNTKLHLLTELAVVGKTFDNWSYLIKQEKLMYIVLNKFDMDGTRRCLVGEGWIPASEFQPLRQTLRELIHKKFPGSTLRKPVSQESISLGATSEGRGSVYSEEDTFQVDDSFFNETADDSNTLIAVMNELATTRAPPTFHRTNKFTAAFQLIIDAYGIATYQEVNPGLATIVTFPFMFAIMFGDLGHGFIVFLIALYLIWNEKYFNSIRTKDELFGMAFSGRYILLLMGIYSMYTGLLFNDVFSKAVTLFKSGWKWEFPEGYDFVKDGPISLVAKKVEGYTYHFGLDWAWHGAENNLLFTNSFKMKLSVLVGFVHMNYSLFFSLVNYRFFRSNVDIIGNFIPGFLFMQSIFGYLVFAIIYKWTVDWQGQNKQAPGLLTMLINMFLSPGYIDVPLYRGQKLVQIVLVLVAIVCVPWLLLYKPMTLKRNNMKAREKGYTSIYAQIQNDIQNMEEEEALLYENEMNRDSPDEVDMLDDSFQFPNDIEPFHHNSTTAMEDTSFNFGDIVIHQVIHTIEFCLNCVSHTASYLRLWALSLAHTQLSSVLWSMTIQNAFGVYGAKGVFMTVFLFALWFVLTVAILVLMEGTSALLHSLRLHWVEAMSKFFEGEGYAYEPFSFNSIDI